MKFNGFDSSNGYCNGSGILASLIFGLIVLSCANQDKVRIRSYNEANHIIEYRTKKGQHKLFANDSVLYGVKVHESLSSITLSK